ncbi:MAG: hypothetical protein Kow0065_17060 [Methylomicrobium sp.]
MANSKKIIIKINRATESHHDDKRHVAHSEVTVWHINRIAWTLLIAIILVVVPYIYLDKGVSVTKQNESSNYLADADESRDEAPYLTMPSEKGVESFKTIRHYKVPRGVLTNNVVDKEPVEELLSPIVLKNNQTRKIYYFTEIKDMKGRQLYHQWIRNKVLLQKDTIRPAGNRWRVSSNRGLSVLDRGKWIVQLIDDKGLIYNEIQFDVVAAAE